MKAIPADFRRALAKSAKASAKWKGLTAIGRRDFMSWIESAKQDATRARRVQVAIDKLEKGQRRPCCYAVVPTDLYGALKKLPKAQAGWKALASGEKRDYADWIAAAKDKDAQAVRIAKACVALAAGKKRP
jgi:uncharacterized protein YdeI (YjbR/CyaY-like superfamily)